ncbi:lacC [Symbiodinium microadriaticum]|nr:lacC [Symbiodinium microadriaticum]
MKKAALVVTVGLGVVGFMAMPKARRFCQGLDLGAFQGKSNLGLDAEMALKADALKSVKKHTAAQKIVLKAMKSTGRKYSNHYEQRQVRSLPENPADAAREMLTKEEIVAYKATRPLSSIRPDQLPVSEMLGDGDDINAIIRTCPAPRDGESELACQVVTFINLIVVHCQDFLDVSALCGASISGIITSAAAMAPYGAAVHAACAEDVLKNPKKQELLNGLYTVPTFHRRLEEVKKVEELKDAMANLKDLRQKLEAKLGFNASVPTMYSEANLEQMIQLMNDGIAGDAETSSMRGSSEFTKEAITLTLVLILNAYSSELQKVVLLYPGGNMRNGYVLPLLMICIELTSCDKAVRSPAFALVDDDPCLRDPDSQDFQCGTALLQSGNRRLPPRKAAYQSEASKDAKKAGAPLLEDLLEVASKASYNASFLGQLESLVSDPSLGAKGVHGSLHFLQEEHSIRLSTCDAELRLRLESELKLTELYNRWLHLDKACQADEHLLRQELDLCLQAQAAEKRENQTSGCAEHNRLLQTKVKECSSIRAATRSTGCARASQAAQSCSSYSVCRTRMSAALAQAGTAAKAVVSGQHQSRWLATATSKCLRDRLSDKSFNHSSSLLAAKACQALAEKEIQAFGQLKEQSEMGPLSFRCRCQAKLSRLFLGLALATLWFRVPAPAMSEPPSPAGLLVLGLNPGLQTILRLRDLDLGQVNRAEAAITGVGGKGQNAAKAAKVVLRLRPESSCPVTVCQFLGGSTGEEVKRLLSQQGIHDITTQTGAATRQLVTLVDYAASGGNPVVTELVAPSQPIEEAAAQELLARITDAASSFRGILLMGTWPNGTTSRLYQAAAEAKATGALCVLDAVKPVQDIEDLLASGNIDIYKVNAVELCTLMGAQGLREGEVGESQVREAVSKMFDKYPGVKHAAITAGPQAAFLFSRDSAVRYDIPKVDCLNPIGAGDTVAGVLMASWCSGLAQDFEEAMLYGLASATAKVKEEGEGGKFDIEAMLTIKKAISMSYRRRWSAMQEVKNSSSVLRQFVTVGRFAVQHPEREPAETWEQSASSFSPQALGADLAKEVAGVSFMQEGIERADALPRHLHKVLMDSMVSVPMFLALFTLVMLWARCTVALTNREQKEPSTPSAVDAWCVQGAEAECDGKWLCHELIVPRNSRCAVTVPRMLKEGPWTAVVSDKMGQCMFKVCTTEAQGLQLNIARQDGAVLAACQISLEGDGSCQILKSSSESPFATLEWEALQARGWFRWKSAGPGGFVLRSRLGALLQVTGGLEGLDGRLYVQDARKRSVAEATLCRGGGSLPDTLHVQVVSPGATDLGLVLAVLLAVDRLQASSSSQ